MPNAVPHLMIAALLPAGTIADAAFLPNAAAAQAATIAEWSAPAQFLSPALTGEAPETAAQCLALAITYEAGYEPVAGQEAVAQVIMNRVRHPAYPDTVCGVVWQGSQRRTGCQFTFTCDGSLRRSRTPAALAAAQQVAVRVLAGATADHVRGATHYHANYVSPYWAPSLIKVRQIAAHIFYRTPGTPLRNDGAPILVTLAATQNPPAPLERPLPQPANPAFRNGEYAPWGLALSTPRP